MSITNVTKAKLGTQDLLFDLGGTGVGSAIRTSTGGFRNVSHINASHIPSALLTRTKTRANGATTAAYEVDGHLKEIYDDLTSIGVADDVTLEVSSNKIQIKNDGVSELKIINGAVTEDKLGALAVTNAKLATDAVEAGNIKDGEVGATELATNSVSTIKIQADAITEAKIADDQIFGTHLALNSGGGIVKPSHFPVLGGNVNQATKEATHVILGIDPANHFVVVTNTTNETSERYILRATLTTDNLTIEFNLAPASACDINYLIFRQINN